MRPWESRIELNHPVSSEEWSEIDRAKCHFVGLKLNGAEHTDRDLRVIMKQSSFQSLQDVGFYRTSVTRAAILDFKQSNPDCIIHSHTALSLEDDR
ncbi:MAG TPA: hypothetical protein DDW52_27105 [Planctomycetaceae bacterium]|nr:hypothetical protein [Planctomycetaceae bacterium]